MAKAWLTYFLLRIGVFALVLWALVALTSDWLISALLAAVISLAISLLFFGKQRDALSKAIFDRSQREPQAETEDDLLDKNS